MRSLSETGLLRVITQCGIIADVLYIALTQSLLFGGLCFLFTVNIDNASCDIIYDTYRTEFIFYDSVCISLIILKE